MKKFYIIIASITYRQIALFLAILIISAIIFLFYHKSRLFGRSDMLHSSSCTTLSRLLSQKSRSFMTQGINLNSDKNLVSVSPAPVRWLGHCDRRHWVVVQLFGGLGNQLYVSFLYYIQIKLFLNKILNPKFFNWGFNSLFY